MKTNPPNNRALTLNAARPCAPSRELLRKRACELAVLDGRSAQDASKSDWEQAKLESTGHHPRVSPCQTENNENRSDHEQLTEAGVAEAGRDPTVKAAKNDQ